MRSIRSGLAPASVLPGGKNPNRPAEYFRQLPANSAQCLAGHVAPGTGAAQLDPDDVILKAEQLQVAAITLYPGPNGFNGALNYMELLLCVRHIIPFAIGKDD
jgi:hypothetical protein